jgi:hypothetical protein
MDAAVDEVSKPGETPQGSTGEYSGTSMEAAEDSGAILSSVSGSLPDVEEAVQSSDFVAVASVAELGDPRYNTQSGAQPDPTPEQVDESMLQFSVVTLKAENYYKPTEPSPEGFVTYAVVDPYNNGAMTEYDPPASLGVVFANYMPPEGLNDPSPIISEAVDKAEQLTNGGSPHVVVAGVIWWRLDGDDAVNSISGERMLFTELESRILAATEP